jgi:hypothetical protein
MAVPQVLCIILTRVVDYRMDTDKKSALKDKVGETQ